MPELLIVNHQGINNENIEQTQQRLYRAGSWKKQRVVVVIPAGKSINSRVSLYHRSLITPPNQASTWMLAEEYEVGYGFSKAVENILAHPELSQWEYILTLEHDNTPPMDGLVKLIERIENNPEFSAIGGLYYTKGEGGVAQIWGDPKDPVLNFRPQVPVDGQLVECCGTGMGFTLFKMSMFKDEKLRRPWFKTLNGSEGQGVGTQDLHFWSDARKHGYRCAIDCAVKVGHMDLATGTIW